MEPTTQLPAQPAVAWTDLLAAVEHTLEKWEWMNAGSRRPLSHILRDPANEMKVFEMVISMNDVRSKYQKWKAANHMPKLSVITVTCGRRRDMATHIAYYDKKNRPVVIGKPEGEPPVRSSELVRPRQ